ncbi:hypothetical protein Avbf_13965 [Armadillidium vulgare]|nr:hypothetical protein Avbf_13965 [Armadillidium vulgare]
MVPHSQQSQSYAAVTSHLNTSPTATSLQILGLWETWTQPKYSSTMGGYSNLQKDREANLVQIKKFLGRRCIKDSEDPTFDVEKYSAPQTSKIRKNGRCELSAEYM